MKKTIFNITIYIIIFYCIIMSPAAASVKNPDFVVLDAIKVTTFNNDRVMYQRIEKFSDPSKDDSYETLLVIKDHKMYQLTDGYDDPSNIKSQKRTIDILGIYNEKEYDLLTPNKINGKLDYVLNLDRRIKVLLNVNEEFVSTNFGTFYKSIRDKFIKEHIDKFRQIMLDRLDADIHITRTVISRRIIDENTGKHEETFGTYVKGKTSDEVVYSCEDADGDGVTETFTAHASDGFRWGYKSGPNLIFIYKNTDKDIENMIKNLSYEAMNGNIDEGKRAIDKFPKEKDISDLIEFLTPKNPNIK